MTHCRCWISPDYRLLRLIIFYIPLLIIIGFNFAIFALIFRTKIPEQHIKKLLWFPLIFVFCWFWPSVDRFSQAFNGGKEILFLQLLHSASSPLQGILDAFVYGSSSFSGTVGQMTEVVGPQMSLLSNSPIPLETKKKTLVTVGVFILVVITRYMPFVILLF